MQLLGDARPRTRFGVLAVSAVAVLLALAVAIPAGADPTSTTLLGPVLTKDENPVQTSARDLGISVALPDGEALWIFGDTPTVEYTGGAWKTTHFIAGSSAGIGAYTPGAVPAPLNEVVVGSPRRADNQAARFIPSPNNLRIPDGTGRACTKANGAVELGARWPTGAALMPDGANVLVTYIGVCAMSPTAVTVESFGFMEYDWAHNRISVAPVDVFAPTPTGDELPQAQRFGSPVVSGNTVTLFSQSCCSPGTFHTTTIATDLASLSNPASYVTHTIPTLQSAVTGYMDAAVAAYAGGEWRTVAMTDRQGDYEVLSATGADGPWSQLATGTLPGCTTSPAPCYGIIGHPELSTPNALFVSYYLPGYGPGVSGHPNAPTPLSHLVFASIALGPGAAPNPAPPPTGLPPKRPTGTKATAQPTAKPTGSLAVSFKSGGNNGSVILRFTATCTSSDGGATRSAVHAGANAVPITVTGLTTTKHYACSIAAVNGWGSSGPSAASAPVIVGAPGAPTATRATRVGAGKLHVTFTPGAANGAGIAGFTASCTSANGGVSRSAAAPKRPIPVSRLTPGKTYACTVRATNSRGTGPASVESPAVKA